MAHWWRRLRPYLFLVLGVGVVILFAGQETLTRFGQFDVDGGALPVMGQSQAGQTFRVAFDGLYEIDLYVGPAAGVGAEPLLFHLRAAADAASDIVAGTITSSGVGSDGWVKLPFAPLRHSQGQSFYFFVESPASAEANAWTVFRSSGDRYRDGASYVNGTQSGTDLTFQLHSRPGAIAWFRGLFALLAQDKPSLWGQPACYGVLFLLYLALLVLLVRRLARET